MLSPNRWSSNGGDLGLVPEKQRESLFTLLRDLRLQHGFEAVTMQEGYGEGVVVSDENGSPDYFNLSINGRTEVYEWNAEMEVWYPMKSAQDERKLA